MHGHISILNTALLRSWKQTEKQYNYALIANIEWGRILSWENQIFFTHATNKVQKQTAAKMGNLLKQAL